MNHHGFIWHHLDQVHLGAARNTPHVGNSHWTML
jgi:hypothetical protein